MTGQDAAIDADRRQRVYDTLTALLDRMLQHDLPLTEDTRLVDELGLSSSVALYLLLELEEELDMHISVEGFYDAEIKTVGELTDYIVARWGSE